MRYSMSAAALVAAMTVSEVAARPSLRHRNIHTKKDLGNVDWSTVKYDFSGVDWDKVNYAPGQSAQPAAAAVAAPSAAAVASPSAAPVADAVSNVVDTVVDAVSNGKSTASNTVEGLWNSLVGASNDRTSFGQSRVQGGRVGDGYSGETGSPYGSNIIKVDEVGDYDHTNTFINDSEDSMTIVCWNKVGEDGQAQSGSTSATVSPTLTFVLQPSEQQTIAIMDDTQYGCAQATDDISFAGSFQTSWVECNTVKGGDTCNVSAIPNIHGNTYKMSISNTGNDCVSSEEQNSWYLDTAEAGCSDSATNWSILACTKVLKGLDGVDRNGSCYVNTGKGIFTTRMGGQQ